MTTEIDKMPLILDDAMDVDLQDVDDLFGEGVDLTLPGHPLSRHLLEKIDDLRGRGCCQLVFTRPYSPASNVIRSHKRNRGMYNPHQD